LAWWAGTSFAAPIVTGAIAAVLGTGIQRTQEAFNALKHKGIIKQAGTIAEEDVMYVKQG
jgi:subtilase family serine protease